MATADGSEEKPAGASGSDQDKSAHDQAQAAGGPEQAWAEIFAKLQASGSDPAALLLQAMALAANGPVSAMLAASNASSLMFYNAVANQQKTNILSLSVTAKCIKSMLEAGSVADADILDALKESSENPDAKAKT